MNAQDIADRIRMQDRHRVFAAQWVKWLQYYEQIPTALYGKEVEFYVNRRTGQRFVAPKGIGDGHP